MSKKKILLCTDVKFWRLRMGNHSRINSMILFFLKHGFQVTVMGINELTPLDRKQIKAYGKELKVIETRKYNISKIKGKFLYKAFELGIKNVNKIRKKNRSCSR